MNRLSHASAERTATADEWRAVVAAAPPRIRSMLLGGASFVGLDGVRIHPPLGYVADETPLVRKETETTASASAPAKAPSRASE